MAKEKINLAVIGFGYWGPNLVRNFVALQQAKVGLICDIAEKQLKKASQAYPWIKATRNYAEVLENQKTQAVAIATPVKTHYQLALKALRAGKHVLVEKPLAYTAKEAKDLIRVALKKDLILMAGHTFVFTPAVQKLKEIVEKKELGRLFYYDSVRVNLGLYQKDVNVIWDLATHDLAILDFLLGKKPRAVWAVGFSHFKYSPEDMAYLLLEYEENFLAHIHVSWIAPVKIRLIIIGGSKKMAMFDDIQPSEKIKIYDQSVRIDLSKETPFTPIYRHGQVVIPHLKQEEALKIECQHFLESIKQGFKPITDGEAGLRVVEVLEGLEKSLKLGGKKIKLCK